MILSRYFIKQRVTALLLLALLVGITGFKFFHTHDVNFVHFYSQQDHEIVSNDTGEKSLHCPICDYHLTGLVNPDFSYFSIKHTDFSVSFIHYRDAVFSTSLLSYSDRGPPSLMV